MTVGKLQIWLFLWIPMFWFKVRKNRPSGYESQSTSYKYTAAWQRKRKKYNARTSAERSNKREKIDFKLESGRHRSTKMWYCRLYHIMMLQHLDAWDLPFESPLRKLILEVAWSLIIIPHFFRYSDSYVYFSMSIFHFFDNIYFSKFTVSVCWLWSLRIPRDHTTIPAGPVTDESKQVQ